MVMLHNTNLEEEIFITLMLQDDAIFLLFFAVKKKDAHVPYYNFC